MIEATECQQKYLDAVSLYGSNNKAAQALGVGRRTIDRAVLRAKSKPAAETNRIIVIPDVQAKPGVDFSYLTKIGRYILEKQPQTIVCIGDFADLPSLSSYDAGKKSFEGRRYKADVQATKDAMAALLAPINAYNEKAKKPYKPRMVLTLGNHEHRIARVVNDDPKLDGVLSIDDLGYKAAGWEVIPFLEVVLIDGILFSHYMISGNMGRPIGAAAALLSKKHISCIVGHQQGLQIATSYRGDGKMLHGVIAGSCYEHSEEYMGPQGNMTHWRGFLVLHDVVDGEFDLMPVSLKYINKRYSS